MAGIKFVSYKTGKCVSPKVRFESDLRSEKPAEEQQPEINHGEKFTDDSFRKCLPSVSRTAQRDSPEAAIPWKRPTEFLRNPVLFPDHVDRSHVRQGELGDCYLLARLAALAENKNHLESIFRKWDAENGLINIRLWDFGKWRHVFTDDQLPVKYSTDDYKKYTLKAANTRHMAADAMWLPLLEKGFAKRFGGYDKIIGDMDIATRTHQILYPNQRVFSTLTSGLTTVLNLEEFRLEKDEVFFRRVYRSIKTGAWIVAASDTGSPGQGIVGGHEYTVTGAAILKQKKHGRQKLLRLRDPWGQPRSGNKQTLWRGAFGPQSAEMENLSFKRKKKLEVTNDIDREFWMTLHDFLKSFDQAQICSLTPDFENKGVYGVFNNVMQIWGDLSPTGAEVDNFQNGDLFKFTVHDNPGTDAYVIIELLLGQFLSKIVPQPQVKVQIFKYLKKSNNYWILQDFTRDDKDGKVKITNSTFVLEKRLPPGKYFLFVSAKQLQHKITYFLRMFTARRLKRIKRIATVPASIYSFPRECQYKHVKSITCEVDEYYLLSSTKTGCDILFTFILKSGEEDFLPTLKFNFFSVKQSRKKELIVVDTSTEKVDHHFKVACGKYVLKVKKRQETETRFCQFVIAAHCNAPIKLKILPKNMKVEHSE